MDLLEQYASMLGPGPAKVVEPVRGFVEWYVGRRPGEFAPTGNDDVDIRTYLLHLRTSGLRQSPLRQTVEALQAFYTWLAAEGLIAFNPFEEFNFNRPLLNRSQIRRREAVGGDARDREVARLRALYQLAEQLNRVTDIGTALEVTLETLVQVMGLKSAWAYLHSDSGLLTYLAGERRPHDYALCAACNLPPGLERAQRHFLRQPPDCHCQTLLRSGRLKRAVNVVECTRLLDSAEAEGDNLGLLFHASVPLMLEGRPVGILNFATEEWQFLSAADLQLLSASGAHVSGAIDRARLFELVQSARLRLERELEMAREVQASLLPRPLPEVPGYSLAAHWSSAREVAGDFYDAFALPGGGWVLVIADVSDKGAPAALFMAMTRSFIRSWASHSPAALMTRVNRELGMHSASNMFVSGFLAVLDAQAHTLAYANAGHNPPIVRRLSGELELLSRTGPLLGVFEEAEIAEAATSLAPGEATEAYTDGVTEARNGQGDEYGMTRLMRAVASGPAGAEAMLDHLRADLAAFMGDTPQADDITLVVLTRFGFLKN